MRKVVVQLAALLVMACNQNRTQAVGGEDQGLLQASPVVSRVGDAVPNRPGGAVSIDARPRAVLVSPLRGASAADTSVRLSFNVICPQGGTCADDEKATAARLAARVRLVGLAGEVVSTTAQPIDGPVTSPGKQDAPVQAPRNEYVVSLVPQGELRGDAFYDVVLTSDGEAVLGFLGDSPSEQEAAVKAEGSAHDARMRIFTGSFPTIVALELANDAAKPLSSLHVRFSEPVILSSLLTEFKLLTAEGRALGGCPWSAATSKCVDPGSTEVAEAVDYVFNGRVDRKSVMSGQLQLGAGLVGSGRTLGQAQAQAVGGQTTGPARAVVSSLASKWEACPAGGDVLCIRDLSAG